MGNERFDFGHNEPTEKQMDLFSNPLPAKQQCNVDQNILQTVFNHYREIGFPYQSLTQEEKIKEFVSLVNYKGGIDKGVFYSCSTGVALANIFHPHRYEISCNNHRTAMDVFRQDHLLKRCIRKCIAMSGSIDDSKLRSMISIFEGVQVASNFPPGTAKDIYKHFLPDGGIVWDMSCGFGGRLLAALAHRNIKYIGTDPSTRTFEGLCKMTESIFTFHKDFVTPEILNQGSEVVLDIPSESVDFCFTSPPYFNTERYAEEPTQSFKAYPYRDIWIKEFIGGTAENCRRVLRPHRFVALNIANVKSFVHLESETVKEFCRHGFSLVITTHLAYSMMPGKGSKNRQFESGKKYRLEPIFIFQKDN